MPAATEVGKGGATSDQKAPERNEVEAETPHAAYHYDDDTGRRVFEGWYLKVSIPEEEASFCFIHAQEDPNGESKFSKVTTQVLGPHGEYMMQHVRDVRSFWADKKDMAFGATYKLGEHSSQSSRGDGNGNGSKQEDGAAPREIIGEGEFDRRVTYGFQATDTWHQGSVVATEADGDMVENREDEWPKATENGLRKVRWAYDMQPVYGWGGPVVKEPREVSKEASKSTPSTVTKAKSSAQGGSGSSSSEGAAAGGSNARGFGQASEDGYESDVGSLDAEFQGGVDLGSEPEVEVEEGQGQKATTGWLALSPIFDPQWQIVVSHALATGWIELDDKRYEFTNAPAYIEKNWGMGFPKKWFWIQCNNFEGQPDVTITAVGAQSRMVQPWTGYADAGIIGIHYKGTFIEMVPWNSRMSWEVEPWGLWKMSGSNRHYQVEMEVTTDDDGTVLRGPHEDLGFIPYCRDSFEGHMRLKVWRKHHKALSVLPGVKDPEPELLFDTTSSLAAVEVGGVPWEGETWESKCTIPKLLKTAASNPLDLDNIKKDLSSWFGGDSSDSSSSEEKSP